MGAEPEQLEQDIARTRERLGRDVDALAEKVSPTAAAKRGAGRVKEAAKSVRESVMGTATEKTGRTGDRLSDLGQGVGDAAAHTKESVAGAASQAKESVTGAAQTARVKVRQQAQGNPLAAGVIAFGVGWLVSSLIPATKAEEQLGSQLKETAREQAGTVKEQLSSAASQVADELREPAKQAVEQVKQTATDSASTVKDEAAGQTSDLAGEAKDRGQSVAGAAKSQSDEPAYSTPGSQQPPPL